MVHAEFAEGVLDCGSGRSAGVPNDFLLLVRDALSHLYDYAYLRGHPLTRLVDGDTTRPFTLARGLRRMLLDAIEQIAPAGHCTMADKEWRPYGILTKRYVDGLEVKAIAEELGISGRQFRREHRKGINAISAYLYSFAEKRIEQTKGQPASRDGNALAGEVAQLGLTLERVDLCHLVPMISTTATAVANRRGVRLVASSEGQVTQALVWADLTLTRQVILGALSALTALQPTCIHLAVADECPYGRLDMFVEPAIALTDSDKAADFEQRMATVTELMRLQSGSLVKQETAERLESLHLRWDMARGALVLVIDDNEQMLQLYRRYLTAEGYAVTAIQYAAEAQQAIVQDQPDVVILDLMMRNIDGWQVLEQLNSSPIMRDVPVIVCSVLNEPEMAYALGAYGYLKKPVSHHEMISAVRQALQESSRVERRLAEH